MAAISPGRAPETVYAASRLPSVDGLRGLLACVVLVWHAVEPLGLVGFGRLADLSVSGFFALSGYVLARSWGAPYGHFLLRRWVRLWPTYVVCLSGAYAVAGVGPTWSLCFWWPIVSPAVDPPIWSLCVEAWAMLFMPVIVALARGPRTLFFCAFALSSLALGFHWKLGVAAFFLAGAFFAPRSLRLDWLDSPVPQALGRISYSLYLCHWPLMSGARVAIGIWGPLLAVPLTFPLAWVLWRCVEAPSIRFSRRIGSGWAGKRSAGQRAPAAGARRHSATMAASCASSGPAPGA